MLVPKVNTKQTARQLTVPAPIGGLNGRDGLADMPAKDAFVLDNWVPGTATCDARGGNAQHVAAASVGGPVESLIAYVGGAVANKKLLAFGNGKIVDVTTNTPPAALQTGRNSNRIVSTMFSNAGSQFLIGVSGLDVAFSYDGTTVANLTITGLAGSASTLSHVFAFKGRLYFAQKDMLGFYYLGVGAIQGAASYFDLSQIAKKGGYLVATASFSSDSGNGPATTLCSLRPKAST
jgi:fluoride ion exporter CrcB/FEX